jgi:hypothetical protein
MERVQQEITAEPCGARWTVTTRAGGFGNDGRELR